MNSALGPKIYLEICVFTSLTGLWIVPWDPAKKQNATSFLHKHTLKLKLKIIIIMRTMTLQVPYQPSVVPQIDHTLPQIDQCS